MIKNNYSSLSEAVNELTKEGYNYNFNLKDDTVICQSNDVVLQIDEFDVDGVYRFQEMSDVSNESILYAISSTINDMKGLLVNSYSVYSTPVSPKMLTKLHRS